MFPDEVAELLDLQSGVVSRLQLRQAGLAPHEVRRLLRRRDLVSVHPGVYLDHTGPPTWLQRAWVAVQLAAPAALCYESALRAVEGPGRSAARERLIHVAVDLDRKLLAPDGVRIHRVARLDERALWNTSPPRLRYEDALLDVVAGLASEVGVIGTLADACQSRCTSAARLLDAWEVRPRVAHRWWLRGALMDIRDGTCSVLEHGYLTRVERPHGLPRARRQVRAGRSRVVYRDADYGGLVVELDGRLFHDNPLARDRDLERDLEAAIDRRDTVRLGWGQVFERACSTAGKIGVLLAQRGWDGRGTPCGPGCRIEHA